MEPDAFASRITTREVGFLLHGLATDEALRKKLQAQPRLTLAELGIRVPASALRSGELPASDDFREALERLVERTRTVHEPAGYAPELVAAAVKAVATRD